MADYNRYGYGGYGSTPSAPPASSYGYTTTPSAPPASSSSSYGYGHGGGGYPSSTYPPPPPSSSQAYPMGMGGFLVFPPGTHPDVERAFRAVDRDGSGSIDERELQDALSSAYHRFSIRTVRLLLFLFNKPASHSPSRMGPAEFVSLWNCLGQWRVSANSISIVLSTNTTDKLHSYYCKAFSFWCLSLCFHHCFNWTLNCRQQYSPSNLSLAVKKSA
ncbi:hypothetical protein DAI22_08g248200 [Oryza sativa Japonica Group]|nr:hypothetical protein DAI22_08g248200 [Oryza sativa Japonica Group]